MLIPSGGPDTDGTIEILDRLSGSPSCEVEPRLRGKSAPRVPVAGQSQIPEIGAADVPGHRNSKELLYHTILGFSAVHAC